MAATVWDLSLPALLFALGVVVAGGVVRGFVASAARWCG